MNARKPPSFQGNAIPWPRVFPIGGKSSHSVSNCSRASPLVYLDGVFRLTVRRSRIMPAIPEIGDPLPWVTVPTTRENQMPLNGLAGHRVVLSFADPSVAITAIVDALDRTADDLAGADAYWLVVAPATRPADQARLTLGNPRARLILDPDGAVRRTLGVSEPLPGIVSVLTDPGLRVTNTVHLDGTGALDATRRWLTRGLADSPAPAPAMDAPVLLVPEVIEAALRARLIAVWSEGGHAESGYLRPNDDGSLIHVVKPWPQTPRRSFSRRGGRTGRAGARPGAPPGDPMGRTGHAFQNRLRRTLSNSLL